jgi:hypothetical protein
VTLPLFGDAPPDDPEIAAVAAALLRLDPTGDRFAAVLRDTLDQVLDGRRHGRWNYADLLKTEKTYTGTLVEINLHREFQFADGNDTDYEIAGIQVDCKFSQAINGWEIGPQLVGHICLLVWANDYDATWRAGLVRAAEDALRQSRNQDLKRKLNSVGSERIVWLWAKHQRLAENPFLRMDPAVRTRIFEAVSPAGRSTGGARLNQLCREPSMQGRILRRAVIETVGHGLDDPLKRMRANGGARDALRPEGILVLGHQDSDPLIAKALGLDSPRKGQFLAVRVVRQADDARDGRPAARISGSLWVQARAEEPGAPAPVILKSARDDEPEAD